MKTIAILGATGHIAQGLAEHLNDKYAVAMYSRSANNLHLLYECKDSPKFDVIINCIGVREKLWTEPYEIFNITELFDNLCIDRLFLNPGALYISFSSGAVFGGEFSQPAMQDTRAVFDVNSLAHEAFYGISKLNAEAKHRALPDLNIADIRVFSYFSRHLHRDEPALMNQVLTSVETRQELVTSPVDFYRDYIHPKDLARLVERVIGVHDLNAAFDAYSLLPVGKFEILRHFSAAHGLRWRVDPGFKDTSPTGPKLNYYSNNPAAAELGYVPEHTALDAVREEAAAALKCGVRSAE